MSIILTITTSLPYTQQLQDNDGSTSARRGGSSAQSRDRSSSHGRLQATGATRSSPQGRLRAAGSTGMTQHTSRGNQDDHDFEPDFDPRDPFNDEFGSSSHTAIAEAIFGDRGYTNRDLGGGYQPNNITSLSWPKITLKQMQLVLLIRLLAPRSEILKLLKEYEPSIDESYDTQELAVINRRIKAIVKKYGRGCCCIGKCCHSNTPGTDESFWQHISKRAFTACFGPDFLDNFDYEQNMFYVSKCGEKVRFDGDELKLSGVRPTLSDGYKEDHFTNTKSPKEGGTPKFARLPRAYAVGCSFTDPELFSLDRTKCWDHTDINPSNNSTKKQ